MQLELFFADKTVLFTDESVPETFFRVDLAPGDEISRTKVLNFLETHKAIAIHGARPDEIFRRFGREFTPVEAAGGLVVDGTGRWLLIHRNGRWDLPKGHVERGEDTETAALREVAEETGVAGACIVRLLCRTYHAYYMHHRWELKHTHWYEMRIDGCDHLVPQQEEGIERVAWVTPDEAKVCAREMFPSVRRVLESMER